MAPGRHRRRASVAGRPVAAAVALVLAQDGAAVAALGSRLVAALAADVLAEIADHLADFFGQQQIERLPVLDVLQVAPFQLAEVDARRGARRRRWLGRAQVLRREQRVADPVVVVLAEEAQIGQTVTRENDVDGRRWSWVRRRALLFRNGSRIAGLRTKMTFSFWLFIITELYRPKWLSSQ